MMFCKLTHSTWIPNYGEYTFIKNEPYDMELLNQFSDDYYSITMGNGLYRFFAKKDNFYTLSEWRDKRLKKLGI